MPSPVAKSFAVPMGMMPSRVSGGASSFIKAFAICSNTHRKLCLLKFDCKLKPKAKAPSRKPSAETEVDL